MPRTDLIDRKLAMLDSMISSLEANEKVVARIGGLTVETRGEEVTFQTARKDNLAWAREASDAEIQAKMVELSGTLTAEELSCKYGDVRGLSLEKVQTIAMIEDLEIALGTHPGVR